MKNLLVFLIVFMASFYAIAQNELTSDIIKTSDGDLEITFIGHGTLMFQFNDLVIHADPVIQYADYSTLPKADIILITHQHGDHFNLDAIQMISKPSTSVILTQTCSEKFEEGLIMKNGDEQNIDGLNILAVPAYNVVHKRENGTPYHPKGEGNGYVISFGDKKVYIGGDTENFPEMKDMKDIDIAFLPMNLPYTMTPEMVANAVSILNPGILYPYHFGNTNTDELVELLKNNNSVEIRIRDLQ